MTISTIYITSIHFLEINIFTQRPIRFSQLHELHFTIYNSICDLQWLYEMDNLKNGAAFRYLCHAQFYGHSSQCQGRWYLLSCALLSLCKMHSLIFLQNELCHYSARKVLADSSSKDEGNTSLLISQCIGFLFSTQEINSFSNTKFAIDLH